MDRIKHIGMLAKEFSHENKGLFIIIADPKTDHLFAGYEDSFTYGAIKGKFGKRKSIVKEVLMFSKFNKSLSKFTTFKFLADMFITQLAEFLWLPLNRGSVNEFYKYVSDALYYVPKGSTVEEQEPEPEVLAIEEGKEKVTLDEVLNNAEVK